MRSLAERIIDHHEDGESIESIAASFGQSPDYVRGVLDGCEAAPCTRLARAQHTRAHLAAEARAAQYRAALDIPYLARVGAVR